MNSYRKAKKSEELAIFHVERGNHKKAITNFLKAISFTNSKQYFSERIYHSLAYEYYLVGDLQNAKKYIQKCMEFSPGYIEGKMFYGELIHFMGDSEEGLKIIKECNKAMETLKKEGLNLDDFYKIK